MWKNTNDIYAVRIDCDAAISNWKLRINEAKCLILMAHGSGYSKYSLTWPSISNMLNCKNVEPAYPLQAMLVNFLRGGRHREMCSVPDKGAQPAFLLLLQLETNLMSQVVEKLSFSLEPPPLFKRTLSARRKCLPQQPAWDVFPWIFKNWHRPISQEFLHLIPLAT